MLKSLASRPTPALCINSRSLSFHHSLTGLPLKRAARVHEECGVTPLQLVVNAGKSSNNRILERRKKPSSKPYVSGKVKKVIDVKLGDGGGYNVEDPFAGAMTVIALEPKEEEYSSEVSSRLRNVVGRQAVNSEQSVPKTSKILGQDFEDEVIEWERVRIPSKLVQDQDSKKDRDRKNALQATQLVEETASAKSTGDDFMTLYSCSGGENVDDSFTTQARESDENEENEDTDSILELYDGAQDLHRERNEVHDDAIASTNFRRESQNSEANVSGRYRTDGEEDGEEMVSTWEQGPGVSTEFSDPEDYLNELTEKEKRGVPAVMRCFDRAKIYVKAGDGGNGVVAFRREKYVPFGGPSGGSGGIGGNVYIEADAGMTSLLPFRRNVHFRAGRGNHGKGSSREGAMGTDCLVKVPVGTIIRAAGGQEVGGQEGEVLLEMTTSGQVELLLPGGRGGRGNTAFKTGRNKAPQLAEYGEIGPELWIQLELKLVADVGIVGVPNAGKSTLLSAISAAKPEIANYPFTTLLPNLGVVPLTFDASMVVADLPGLMEGAHQGIGLGHEFLRHTERCSVLVQVVDGTCEQAIQEYEAVRLELELFNPALAEKPYVVAYNKMDIQEAADRWPSFQDTLQLQGVQLFCMSAATQQGTMPVVWAAYELLQIQKKRVLYEGEGNPGETLEVGEVVKKIRDAPIEEFTVTCDKHTRTWEVTGAGLERFTQMTNWEYFEAVRRFQHVLDASGVNRRLREEGVHEGDTVIVGQMEFQWKDSDDLANLGDWKRGSRGTKVWPH